MAPGVLIRIAMKVLLLDVTNRLYFAGSACWSAKSEEAIDFGSTVRALDCILKQPEAPRLRIILKFGEERYDILLDPQDLKSPSE